MNFGYDIPKGTISQLRCDPLHFASPLSSSLTCVMLLRIVSSGDVQWLPEGNNFKMADVAAGFIHAYLDDLPTIITAHARVYEDVVRRIESMHPRVVVFPNASSGTPFVSCVPLLFSLPVSEELVVRCGKQHNMDLRKYYKPLDMSAPVSMDLYSRIVCFPCHRDMDHAVIQRITAAIDYIQQTITTASNSAPSP